MPRLVLKKALPPPPVAACNPGWAAASYGILRRRATVQVAGYRGEALGEMPKPVTADSRIAAQDTPRSQADITRNLFTDPQERRLWDSAMGDIMDSSTQEVDLRANLFRAIKATPVAPVVGKTMLRRAVSLWRSRKS